MKCMYKLLAVNEFAVTRDVVLESCETGKIEICFDDSAVRNDNQDDFWFMEIGKTYDCRILLFDARIIDPSELAEEYCMLCASTNREFILGESTLLQIKNDDNIYYVSNEIIKNITDKDVFWLKYSRKDLIQVNDVINPGYL